MCDESQMNKASDVLFFFLPSCVALLKTHHTQTARFTIRWGNLFKVNLFFYNVDPLIKTQINEAKGTSYTQIW